MAFVVIGALAVLGGAFVWGPSGKVAAVWKILVEFPFALVRMVWRLLSRRPTVLDRAILLWFCLMALSFFGSRLCQLGHHESGDGAGKDAELIGIEIIPADLSAPETPPQEAEPPVFARGLQVPSPGMGVVLCLLEANQPSMNPQNALRLGTAARRRKAKHYRRMLVEAISF
ncbi:hypothetical protein Trco_002753 [Trichoderma cornu-damae]|uniref:Uncharacterized protein n=1 Tax=Trichoderma cornu-damae TaxID=654480 RepID=A0A9P8QVH3_9HYPO|nr:hypothetical protein Trco_002753 [Trichoderma cornu-damae]